MIVDPEDIEWIDREYKALVDMKKRMESSFLYRIWRRKSFDRRMQSLFERMQSAVTKATVVLEAVCKQSHEEKTPESRSRIAECCRLLSKLDQEKTSINKTLEELQS